MIEGMLFVCVARDVCVNVELVRRSVGACNCKSVRVWASVIGVGECVPMVEIGVCVGVVERELQRGCRDGAEQVSESVLGVCVVRGAKSILLAKEGSVREKQEEE